MQRVYVELPVLLHALHQLCSEQNSVHAICSSRPRASATQVHARLHAARTASAAVEDGRARRLLAAGHQLLEQRCRASGVNAAALAAQNDDAGSART